ncbi:MAG: ribonuclease III [Bradymonadaceae bacterium]|nr:ribonuclease III [Lujinxingiaceae bacterium]
MSVEGPVGRKPVRHVHREDLEVLEERLGYVFVDRGLLASALTHRSYANEVEGAVENNQRLEFLGDAVLGLVTAAALFGQDTNAAEGILSGRQSQLVCEAALVDIAQELELGSFIRLGKGETITGGREKKSLLSDAYEAVLAAIYLDGGIDAVSEVIRRVHAQALLSVGQDDPSTSVAGDAKSLLQKLVQGEATGRPHYVIVEETGPAHARHFLAEVRLGAVVLGRGQGHSKKQAEQQAAAAALAAREGSEQHQTRDK